MPNQAGRDRCFEDDRAIERRELPRAEAVGVDLQLVGRSRKDDPIGRLTPSQPSEGWTIS